MTGKTASMLLAAAALSGAACGAVIWQEDFDSYADGTTNGTAGKWSVDVSACSFDGDDHFEVRGGQMQGNDLDGEAVWTSELITISGQGAVSVSTSVSDGGGGLEASDSIRLYYKLDGGAETLFSTHGDNSDDFGNLTASQSGLTGASLQLIFRVVNGANTEFISFDNIVVENAGSPTNSAPVLAPIGNQSVTVSNALNFTVSATDADSDPIILSAGNLPPGAVFNTVTNAGSVSNTFNWASASPTGTWNTTFYAHDGTTSDFETVTITVTNAPVAPPLTGAVWNVVYNHPRQSGTAYPNQFLIRDALVGRIDELQSGHSAVLATFTFSANTGAGVIIDAVEAALDRGASVSFIVDNEAEYDEVHGGTESLSSLAARAVNPLILKVDDSSSGIMHDKLGLFDYGGSNQWVFTASWNFTLGASADQWNIALEARSPSLYSIYKAEADELLAGRFHDDPAKSHAHDGSTFTLDGSWGTNFVRFAPYPDDTPGGNNAERDITNLIAQAQSEIVFALNKLNREPIRDALVDAADRGVLVKGVMPRSDTDPGGVSDDIYSYLTNSANYATTNIVHMLPAYAEADYSALDSGESDLVHAKTMVIDPQSTNAVVIHGSANWTTEALVNDNDNDENTLFLRHNKIAEQFYKHFERITGTGAYSEGNSTMVEWDFNDSDQIADGGIAANATQTVVRVPAPSSYAYTDDSLSCSGWQSGSGTKYWETSFSTEEHTDIKVSSVQTASGTGPSDFQLQFKVGAAGIYSNLSGAAVRVFDGGNGVLTRISLPATCNNQSQVFLRWIMTTDTAARRYDNVQSGGRGSIDDIVITGTAYDQPPVLDPIGDQTVFEGETLAFSVTAADPVDGDAVTLSISNRPSGAVFTNGTFSWSSAAPSGVYTSTFYAADKDGADSETVSITVLEKPLLMITEVADPAGIGGGDFRFVELYNAGTNAIDLAAESWVLSRQANGSSWADMALTGSVAAASTYVIAYDAAAFQSAYGFAPDQSDTDVDGTGDDAYFLYYDGDHSSGVLIDLYGVFDTDGSGEAWEYTDGRAVRKSSVLQPNTTWTSSEWVIVEGATPNEAAPGVRGSLPQFQGLTDQSALAGEALSFDVTAADPIDGNAVTVTASNLPTGATFDGTTFNWGAAAPVGIYTPSFVASDADGSTTGTVKITVIEKPLLLISEIADPDIEDAELYRFVEIYNAGTHAIDLSADGWHLSKQVNGGSWSDVELTGTVAAASTRVVANSAADFQNEYGFLPDQESSIASGNGDDAYFLYYGGDHDNGTQIDLYGEIDTDGAGTAWDYENSRAIRKNHILEPNPVWTATEWTLTAEAVPGDMTPGEHGPKPEFDNLNDVFVFLGDDLNLTVTAVNTVQTDTITLSAASLPAGAGFPTAVGTDSVSSTLSWDTPPVGRYTAVLAAAGANGTTEQSVEITVAAGSKIDGDFAGWTSGTIVKLRNGQFWRNTGGAGAIVNPARPDPDVVVTNYLSTGSYRMFVEELNYTPVERIEITASEVTNSFSGLQTGNIYQLADGTAWEQVDFENISSSESPVTAWRWQEGGDTFIRFVDRDNLEIGTCKVVVSDGPDDPAIRSRIDGWFRGWKLDRIFMLENGQFWQQITADDSTDTLYRPHAAVSNHLGTGTWRLYVDGASAPAYVEVRQITGVTRTAIDGRFYGFGRDEIFHLADGSWWQQTSTETSGSIRNSPEILLWSENGTDYIEMPDEGRAVAAEPLDVVTEGRIVNSFNGLRYAHVYGLANGSDWMQISFENIPSDAASPCGMVWNNSDKTYLAVRDAEDRPIGTCQVADPWGDDDGDGVLNQHELIAGTSLFDRNDLFLVTLGSPDANGRTVLRWPVVAGRIYIIEWTPSLTQSFQPLETLTDWTQDHWTDTVNPPGSGGFYRITAQRVEE